MSELVAEAKVTENAGHGISFSEAFRVCNEVAHGFAFWAGQLWVSPVASRHQR